MCNSNGERATNCRRMTMRTPQSFFGGTMLTGRIPRFGRHVAASLDNGVPLPNTLRLHKNPGTQRRIIPLILKTSRNNRPSNVSP